MSKPFYVEEGSSTIGQRASKDKKQILLIGDSIRIGYCQHTKKALEDIADVYFPEENCRNSQYIITSLRLWLNLCDPNAVDLVMFNCGHWDVAHWSNDSESLTPIDQYEKNIARIIRLINLLFPNAKVAFATTTPMNPTPFEATNPRSTQEIIEYNKVAVERCKQKGIDVIDIFDFTKCWKADAFSDYAHFTKEKSVEIGNFVATKLKNLL